MTGMMVGLGFAAAFIAWAIAAVSLFNAALSGTRAASHLGKAQRKAYLVQLLMAPSSDGSRSLLSGRGTAQHEVAAGNMRRARVALIAFVAIIALLLAAAGPTALA